MCNLFDTAAKTISAYSHSMEGSEKEPFIGHCNLVVRYYNELVSAYDIHRIYRKIFQNIDSDLDLKKLVRLMGQIIKFHDIGKLSKKFQNKLDGAKNNETHSDKSFAAITCRLLFLSRAKQISEDELSVLRLLSYIILKHHSHLGNLLTDFKKFTIKKDEVAEVFGYLQEKDLNSIIKLTSDDRFWQQWGTGGHIELVNKISTESLSFFILLKLLYSILICADSLGTEEWSEAHKFEFNFLNKVKITQIVNNFNDEKIDKNFNPLINRKRETLKNLRIDTLSCKTNKEKGESLNQIRSFLNIYTEDRLKTLSQKNPENKVYFLNVPTGGGKTNLSFRLALELIKTQKLRKIFYVFPFINLIEQSFGTLAKFVGSENIMRLDSRYVPKKEENEGESDVNIRARYLENQFMNYPILVLSHVKFFNIIFGNSKRDNYNFHEIANSVVIIDEIQAYTDQKWTEVAKVLQSLGRFLNTYFIVMSATLPSIDHLISKKESSDDLAHRLLEDDVKAKIFQHPAFKRVLIKPVKWALKDEEKNLNIRVITQALAQCSGKDKILFVVNKIKDSREAYKLFAGTTNMWQGHQVLLLNSTIASSRRWEVLSKCQQKDAKILLFATQSIEAGVDIDFDIGFRAYAPLDSIVQIAGRINRNSMKDLCSLYIFWDPGAQDVYRKGPARVDISFDVDFVNNFFSREIFTEEEMPEYYEQAIKKIVVKNQQSLIKNSQTNIDYMKNLNYKEVSKIQLIEDEDTIPVFIPYEKKALVLWEEYIEAIKGYLDTEEGKAKFTNKLKIREKNKELIPYVLNIRNSYLSKEALNAMQNNMSWGFYYLKSWQDCYSISEGLDMDEFKELVNQDVLTFV